MLGNCCGFFFSKSVFIVIVVDSCFFSSFLKQRHGWKQMITRLLNWIGCWFFQALGGPQKRKVSFVNSLVVWQSFYLVFITVNILQSEFVRINLGAEEYSNFLLIFPYKDVAAKIIQTMCACWDVRNCRF